ncbi:MAG: hypothetical protein JJU35_12780 [Balneolales bacterium]|nr:hypothetical protein [Balneolales bacterium]
MKDLKVQVIEFFLDQLMRQHHEAERDLNSKIDSDNVIQLYSLNNYRTSFLEQIKLGKEVGLSTDEVYELASLVNKDEMKQFENFSELGIGDYIARIQFGMNSKGEAGGSYDLFRYKNHFLLHMNNANGNMHFRVTAKEELTAPFFLDLSMRQEFGMEGLENIEDFSPMLIQASPEHRLMMVQVFVNFILNFDPDEDQLATFLKMMCAETDYPTFQQQLGKNKDLYEGAETDARNFEALAKPDADGVTFTLPEAPLAAWLSTLSTGQTQHLLGLAFLALTTHYEQ